MNGHSAEKDAAERSAAALESEHLRHHLTDGRWHDRCSFCLHRRRFGGNGVTKTTRAALRPPSASPPVETSAS